MMLPINSSPAIVSMDSLDLTAQHVENAENRNEYNPYAQIITASSQLFSNASIFINFQYIHYLGIISIFVLIIIAKYGLNKVLKAS